MKLTVKAIIEMLESGKLQTEQTTQRQFIYNSITKKLEDGEITKAGNVLKSILQYKIQLPALYFWERDGKYNVHDGKQRILSIRYFVKPTREINVITRINGREASYISLSEEQRKELLEYEFDIVVAAGEQEKEETTFDLINTNAVPLTEYESLRGMFYGTFLYEFEQYIESKSKVVDAVKGVGRGEQAKLFLYNCFELLGEKVADRKIRTLLRHVRNSSFDAKTYKMEETIAVFSEVSKILGVSDEKALGVAAFIVGKGYDKDMVCDYFRRIVRKKNDVKSWDVYEHFRVAINNLINNNIECDGKRKFASEDKDVLYGRSQKCAGLNCKETNYKKLEVDHIKKWSEGGPTVLDNARLLCKSCNASEKYN
ncbi:MAG: HNH endonuclease [Firmicutes bacterium]|nr:HNH endonuclease [Bacillota bacterium]